MARAGIEPATHGFSVCDQVSGFTSYLPNSSFLILVKSLIPSPDYKVHRHRTGGTRYIDETGKRFGRLVVLKRSDHRINSAKDKRIHWVCKCDCGKIVDVRGASLRIGRTRSCGCLHEDIMSARHSKSRPVLLIEDEWIKPYLKNDYSALTW